MALLIIILLAAAVVAGCYGIYRLVRRTGFSNSSRKPDSTDEDHTIVGTVGGFQARSEESGKASKIVWTFRIERFDAEGNRLSPIPVQMKARAFNGFVTDGDRVSVKIWAWKPGKLLSPKSFYNETTQSEVSVGGACFIATVAFGDPNDKSVQFLRSYRDASLHCSAIGRRFVSSYYSVSPTIASLLARSELAQRVTRGLLRLVIWMLNDHQSFMPKRRPGVINGTSQRGGENVAGL